MAELRRNGSLMRPNPFARQSASPSPVPPSRVERQGSLERETPPPPVHTHNRNHSFSPPTLGPPPSISTSRHARSQSLRHSQTSSSTFAPQFIKTEDDERSVQKIDRIEGENDFTGRRYVWLKDPEKGFVQGWVVEETRDDALIVQLEDGGQREIAMQNVDKVNPAKFDKADDMAELTHLNEPSVVHNLHTRYQADLIYTYSGLFLVAVNPYCPLPIYNREYVNMYKGQSREDTKPHIFAVTDEAFRSLIDEGRNQSILVTGESGAGKTENTKKVIQYLAAVAVCDTPRNKSGAKGLSNLSQQILRANPILESFGNAQTVRNNNSSRFGKFIRIQFTKQGQIAGALIDWYLLEKSRVVRLNQQERNYHIFYQLLKGADSTTKAKLLLKDKDVEDFEYTRYGNDVITGVSDREEWNSLLEAFHIMAMPEDEQIRILRTIAAILYLGNVSVVKETRSGDQASLDANGIEKAQIACKLLGVSLEPFAKALLHPRVKAGREWVEKAQTPEQVRFSIDALSKGIYERGFGDLVERINRRLNQSHFVPEDAHFIGVLDIAGFEIFEENSFEQLCINYTNEKLQQFFNHHMFVLEQEEYAREQIEWKFIDFGKDLQPTIDLIELPNPIGVFSCLDEESVMPKATDKTFTEKMHSLWDGKSQKYKRSLLKGGFMLTHYAAEVEYSTDGWIEKNKDPMNDNLTRLLAESTDEHVRHLFADCADYETDTPSSKSRVKKGLFRTVAQRHKEQLTTLMSQLHSTHPHFVRCILPNHKKRPKLFNTQLVLDQLRCNGVLEGIRIARTGFPNRLTFAEFRSRYEVLCVSMPKGYLEGQAVAKLILNQLDLNSAFYRVGLTKVFFRAGVLAELEEKRDTLIREIVSRFQSVARGFVRRRAVNKRLYRAEAARVIQRNFQVYLDLQANPWWRLFVRMKPLLGATRQTAELKRRDEVIQNLELKMRQEANEKQKLDEDRRKAEVEISKVQKVLEAERALALDKEEIFKRLQEREAELNEKLAGALDDQDALEEQLDELIDAKQQAEERVVTLKRELEQAGNLMAGLEEEKHRLSTEIAQLQEKLTEIEDGQSERSKVEDELSKEVKVLTSQIGMKDRKIQDLESKVLKADEDLETKLNATTKELQATKRQLSQTTFENKTIQAQLTELTSASTGWEDSLRIKNSELSILRSEKQSHESTRRALEDEARKLSSKHDVLQSQLRDVEAELKSTKSYVAGIEKEALQAKQALQQRLDDDERASQGREILDQEIEDLKAQLHSVQADLTRERQSRDDVQMLSEHQLSSMKRDYESLNQAKITIEKELYAQQDVLRRTSEGKNATEREKKELQDDLRNLRQRFLEAQEAKLEAETAAEQKFSRQAHERQAVLRRELDEKVQILNQQEDERSSLMREVQQLKGLLSDSETYRMNHDKDKERVERELVTVKGRLTASENDNRALLNKIQQKNLDIARSNSRASDNQRSRLAQLQSEKSKRDEENQELNKQLEESRVHTTALEKQKEKLSLQVEDLHREIEHEQQSARNAEKASSTAGLQLADANRKLESERQLRSQTQATSKAIQSSLDQSNRELQDCHQQLILLHKVFDPSVDTAKLNYESFKPKIAKTVDLAQKLQDAESAARTATEKLARAEAQIEALRSRHEDEIMEVENRFSNSKRALLEELDQNQINARATQGSLRNRSENIRPLPQISTPTLKSRYISNASNDSAKSEKTVDSSAYNERMDFAAEVELLQNQLQMSEMRNRHLQSQLERPSSQRGLQDESPSVRRVQRLEKENFRLHDMLDDSSKKVSALENSIRTGQLSLQEVQSRSHQELFDLLNSQEQSRRSLLQVHNTAIAELADAKIAFDDIKQNKSARDVELRDLQSELEEIKYEREQEQSSHSQLLQEFSELQLKLDSEASKLADTSASLHLYKHRADEYYSKLEQAEIATLRASRAEQFAKSQSREAEDTCATIISERKQMDSLVEDLQKQIQGFEERTEDLSADLESALLAKKRLHNELEDYRNQRAMDIEDKESSIEQTRRKYQSELLALTGELEIERENVISAHDENSRMRDELEELRAKWDDEVLNSSTWAKEKSRLEMTLESLSTSRDEAASAHNEAQAKIVSLLSQVRSLRTDLEDTAAERDSVAKEKKSLETRLHEASERLEDLANTGNPATRNAAGIDKELLQLKSNLAQQEDVAAAAIDKMRRSDALAQEAQKDLASEREKTVHLHKEKASLDKTIKDLQLKLVDLETKGYSSGSQDVRFLHGRIQELEKQLESLEDTRSKEQRSVRSVDRTVKDLQMQIERREKSNSQLQEDVNKSREKIERLLQTIDELQSQDSNNQLQAKRAERQFQEEKEKSQRLERELEGWKALRVDRSELRRSSTFRTVSEIGSVKGRDGDKGSLRKPSASKGFL